MKKLLLLPLLALALFAGASTAPKHSALAPPNAKAVCPPSPSPDCGGSVCTFDLMVQDGTNVFPCGHNTGLTWRYMVYSRSGELPCTAAGFIYGQLDRRCDNPISNLRVLSTSVTTNNDPILQNFGGCGVPCPVHMWGYVQA